MANEYIELHLDESNFFPSSSHKSFTIDDDEYNDDDNVLLFPPVIDCNCNLS